ncbi:MAG: TonB-dependent receptor, partial [Bacteroidales bacterium]|nr:TonB-dependent receptor [Bacteroidales bacterium]
SNYGSSADLTYNTGIQYKAYAGNSTLIAGIENTGGFLKDKKLGYPDLANAVIVNESIIEIPHAGNTIVSDQSLITTGLFLQYDLKYHRFKTGIGGRIEYYEVTDRTGDTEKNSGVVFSPRINIMYELLPYLQLRLSYSQGYRAPQIFDEDLHIEASGARRIIHRNDPDLTSEISRSLMASLDFRKLIGTVSAGMLLETFYTRLENPFFNEIGIPDQTGTVVYTRRNSDKGAAVKGINLEFNLKPLTRFSFTSGYTLQMSRYDIPHEFNTRKFLRTPENYGYMSLDWDFKPHSCLSATGTYTGRMLVPYFGPDTDAEAGELRESDPFFDLGLKISENVRLNGATLQLFGGVKNLFNSFQSDFDSGINRDPAYIYGPLLPRTIYFGIKIGNQLGEVKKDTMESTNRIRKQNRFRGRR